MELGTSYYSTRIIQGKRPRPCACRAGKWWRQEGAWESTLQIGHVVPVQMAMGQGDILGLPPHSYLCGPRKKCQLCPCPQIPTEESGRSVQHSWPQPQNLSAFCLSHCGPQLAAVTPPGSLVAMHTLRPRGQSTELKICI